MMNYARSKYLHAALLFLALMFLFSRTSMMLIPGVSFYKKKKPRMPRIRRSGGGGGGGGAAPSPSPSPEPSAPASSEQAPAADPMPEQVITLPGF